MSKQVLVISASPRREGNSDLLCTAFVEGARQAGHHAEKLFLRDKKISPCTGCGTCFDNGGVCAQKDDMAEILEKMVAADVIVMGTPVYFYTMISQMKMLIDRTAPRYREITNKEFYFIVTGADSNPSMLKRTIEGFRSYLICLEGPVEKGILLAPGVIEKGEVKATPAMQQAFEMGKAV